MLLVLAVLTAGGCTTTTADPDPEPPPPEPPPAEVAGLVDGLLSPEGQRLFYAAHPRLLTKAEFDAACPNDSELAVVLGCYHRGTISILRVDRPDLAPVMTVTAAHEMLHAAYVGLSSRDRGEVDGWVGDFYADLRDPEIRDLVTQYDRREPQQRGNELHSILPTEVSALSPPLEAYYRRYFIDRQAVVRAHESYAAIFRELERRVAGLHAELDGLKGQLNALEAQMNATRGELESLNGQLDRLEGQGDIRTYNALVPRQNALVAQYNGLVDRFNQVVDLHNRKVDEVNGLALQQDQLATSLGSKPSLPTR